jgi:hypothetical protein
MEADKDRTQHPSFAMSADKIPNLTTVRGDSMSWLVQSHAAPLYPSQVVIARSGQPLEGAAGTRRDRSPFSTARTRQSEPAELAAFHVGSPVNCCVLNPPYK